MLSLFLVLVVLSGVAVAQVDVCDVQGGDGST
jgi:hypothetical protein